MTYEDLRNAAKVFHLMDRIWNYVSKERFAMVAATRFGIDDERELDLMYGLLNMTPRLVYYIANEDNEAARKTTRWPEYMKLMPKAVEIAESAYSLRPAGRVGNNVPNIEEGSYYKEDRRRYFYTEDGKERTLDVNLGSRADILLLGELLQRDGIGVVGVAEHLGHLDGELKGNSREKFQYFDGDIYFLYPNPTDPVFYSWYSRRDEAGVYVATEKGWRKLLYTAGRGYLDKNGKVEFEDDEHFYSDYKLEQSGMGFRYIGNIHHDVSVLREKRHEEKED